MVIENLKKEVASLIGAHDASLLIRTVLKMSVTDYTLCSGLRTSDELGDKIINDAQRIKLGEPLQYITGETEFMSLPFKVTPAVLIPRPDTETLTELAIKTIGSSPLSVLEIGTGSGCISISIAHYCKNASVTALDISKEALNVASQNADGNNVKIEFIHGDIMEFIPDGKFDIIVSNPPYIPTTVIDTLDMNVKKFEPHTALDGGNDGLDFYRRITCIAPGILKDNGYLMYEVGHDQANSVSEIMKNDFTDIRTEQDLCGISRVVYAKLKNGM